MPPIPKCTGAFWNAGFWPALSFDPAGNPRIGFEVQLWNGGGGCSAGVRARLTRVATFAPP